MVNVLVYAFMRNRQMDVSGKKIARHMDLSFNHLNVEGVSVEH